MFDIAPTELLLVAIVALLVIGPKDLPRAMRVVGQWVGRARGMARHFRSGIDTMIRESELAEMEKRWAEENRRIMAEHPATADPAPNGADPFEPEALPSPVDAPVGDALAEPEVVQEPSAPDFNQPAPSEPHPADLPPAIEGQRA